jgi:dTDP-4-dehydrorhamnose reductase
MRILVTGASGLLGLNFGLQFAGQHTIIGLVNEHQLPDVPFEWKKVDLSQPGAATEAIRTAKPDVILHCAALANVDACERLPELAQRLNTDLPAEIAAAARRAGTKLVHISTDAVFDGRQEVAYSESSPANPINAYARTKLAGEAAVLSANPEAIIARVNFYGWSLSGSRSLGELFINNLQAGRRMNGFTDVWFCPLQVNVLGEILLKMVEKNLSGLYHTVSRECLSKYDFGCRIARLFGLDDGLIDPVSWRDGNLTSPRSPNLRLDTTKLEKALGQPLPGQAEGSKRFFDQYRQSYPETLKKMNHGMSV